MTSHAPEPNRFDALTGIRFPLALWVVAYHLSGRGHLWESLTASPVLATVLSHAYVSLGTFFALSGFLLTIGYSGRSWTGRDISDYLVARFARIYPLYLFSLLMIAPIMASHLKNPALGSPARRAGILFEYLFLLQGWTKLPVDWNTPAWSLSCEVVFYACFPLVVLLLRGRRRLSVILMIALAFGTPLLVRQLGLPEEWKVPHYAGDFFAGMAAAWIYNALSDGGWRGRGAWFYMPGLLAAFALVLFGQHLHPWMLFDEAMRLANAGIVLGLALGGGAPARLLSSRLLLSGGSASYAIYILHVPVLWWFARIPLAPAIPALAAGLLYITVVGSVSMLVSRVVEFPLNEWIRALWRRRNLHAHYRTGPVLRLNLAPLRR